VLVLASILLAQTLPQGGSVPLGVALGAGIILWLLGAKLVKPVFLLLGLAAGGFVGATLLPMTGIPPFDLGAVTLSPGITGVLIGGLIGALVALALFRVVITMTAALAFAAAGLMGALVFLHFNPTPPGTEPGNRAISDAGAVGLDTLGSIDLDAAQRSIDLVDGSEGEALLDEQTRQELLDAAQRSRAFIERAAGSIRAELERRPVRDKTIAFASMFAGLALGLLVGVTMPNRTAALVTALLGSAVAIGAAVALATAQSGALPGVLDRSPVVWGIAWIVLTLVGLLVQLGFLRRTSRNTSTSEASED